VVRTVAAIDNFFLQASAALMDETQAGQWKEVPDGLVGFVRFT
jgi:hypothetical protein